MNPTYLQEIELSEETLAHYGILGMHWGVRKDPERKGGSARKKKSHYSATPRVKKQYKGSKGGFTRNSAARVGSSVKNIADMWGNSAGRGEKLVKSGNSKEYGYFDSKKDTGYLKALLRGTGRSLQIGIATMPVTALSMGLAKTHPMASAAVSDIIKTVAGAASTANAARTLVDISNTRDVRNYQKLQKRK